MTSNKIWIWKNVPGIIGRYNDIIYSYSMLSPSQDILVYFGGDIQVHKIMFIIITLLNKTTMCKHILIIGYSRKYGTYS